jgi:HK97 family phage major capsid protein
MERITELRQERSAKIEKQRKLIEKADKEDRGMTDKEDKEFNKLDSEIDDLEAEIKSLKAEIEKGKRAVEKELGGFNMNKRVLGKEDRLVDVANKDLTDGIKPEELSLGRMVRGIVTGNWDNAQAEKRTIDQSGTGAYLVPEILSSEVIDQARSQAVCFNAGAKLVPMESNTLDMARVASGPSGSWKEESAAISAESDMTFENVKFEAKTLYMLATVSIEEFEDAEMLDQTIRNAIAKNLALQLDLSALRGSGTDNNPTGILNQSGILNKTAVGLIEGYNEFSLAYQDILSNNFEPNAVIYAPAVWGAVDRFVDGGGEYITPPKSYQKLNELVSSQIPTDLGDGSDETEIYMGDFTNLLIGSRKKLKIEASRTAESGFKEGTIAIRAYLRSDVQLANPKAFKVLEGVTV